MKNKFNTLLKYIFDNSVKEYNEETINGLFRSILQPIISNQKFECSIFLRLFNIENKQTLFKRLQFSSSKMYSFCDNLKELELKNLEKEKIWDNTEFIIVLGQRYSVALLWDYSKSEMPNSAPMCILYNSKIISDIAKVVGENSKIDLKEIIAKYNPDRRENLVLNQSISNIVASLDDKNVDMILSEKEKKDMVLADDKLQTAEIVADKARFIAHEIKNSLSIINLYSKIMEKRFETVTADKEVMDSLNNALNLIVKSSENVSSLINDLRCLSAPYMTEISLRSFIINTSLMCQEKANKCSVLLKVNDFKEQTISTDKTRLQSALTNIIFNGIEACKEECKVEIDCVQEDNKIKIIVKNNGTKIPDDLKDKIFEVNFTTKEKGNGLGLAICKKQMELVGGDISLLSSTDKETVFEITLPID